MLGVYMLLLIGDMPIPVDSRVDPPTTIEASAPLNGTSWPAFRGDGRSVTAAGQLPLEWGPQQNIAYRVTLPGYGQSSPVVWKDQAYLTAIDSEQKEKLYVVAVHLPTGRIAWQKEFSATQKGRNNPMMSRAAATPASTTVPCRRDGSFVTFG